MYLLLPLQRAHRHQFGTLRGLRIDTELMRRILAYGFPSGLQMLLDVAGFTVFIMFIGRLGDLQAEATSMAFSVSTLAFMPIYGLHLGVSVLVGEHLGENREEAAARATYTTLQVSWIYMAVISLLYVFVPRDIPAQFLFAKARRDRRQARPWRQWPRCCCVSSPATTCSTQPSWYSSGRSKGPAIRVSCSAWSGASSRHYWAASALPQRRGLAIERLPVLDADRVLVLAIAAAMYVARFWQGEVAADARNRGERRKHRPARIAEGIKH